MVLYEMMTGLPPWYTRNRQKLFDRVRNAPLVFPSHMSEKAQSLISGLLNRDPKKRLGSKSASDVKAHPFFEGIDWTALDEREVTPPFNPCQQRDDTACTKNFEEEFTKMNLNSVESSSGSLRMGSRNSLSFQGFTYDTPSAMSALNESEEK